MISLIWTIFILHIAIFLVNTIGAATIDNLLWLLYLKLPTSLYQTAQEQTKLKREVVQLKRDMNNTSSQDEFAKWAKLRRRHDKALSEYEALNQKLSSQKGSFDWFVKIARWLSTTGLKIFIQFRYSKTPVFELPGGWLPYPVEWVLAFPRAPQGSVSVQVWNSVCATAVTVIAEIITGLALQVKGSAQAVPATAKKA
uniref:Protein get1 n=1 Tax=Emericella nidulans (strain FGSC A4 / ATCC 38163 / CBS 112.46 / NRRL 194 / M139) TaxID=227321 RepID=GET1_EMENI|nr:RecName: Full=Protein get1; AltName: Full=Guided entry of tail-anchored proteins 1 [Aspergillus nidulans FGSC A4]